MRQGWLFAVLTVAACGEAAKDPVDPIDPGTGTFSVRLETVASNLASPVFATAPAGDTRLFIVEQAGRILILENGQLRATPFLDIRASVLSGGERGLLGMAFHPRYAQNGFFYVDYTDRQGHTRVERYRVSADRDRADPGSATLIIGVEQPFSNHNGGQVEFGPDGMLYVGLGDGGSGGDPLGHGQNRGTLLGSLLRLDVDGGTPYAVPADNPFRTTPGARPEIWAYGLRNPWRFAFDAPGGRLYIADVGQSAREEVNAVAQTAAGLNYGWNIMEGRQCFRGGNCATAGLTLPVLEYAHDEGCSITGGVVYRGTRIPALVGHYVYSDYCAGWIRSFLMTNDGPTTQRQWDVARLPGVVSFGRDGAGEIYVISVGSGGAGALLRVVPGG